MAYMSDYLSYTPAQFYKATYNDLKKYLSGGGGGGGGITSVNGQTGPIVTLTAADVGAVSTVNGQSGPTVTLTAADVGAVSSNIYTANGSTPGLRTVTLGGNLVFSGNQVEATKFYSQGIGVSTTVYPIEVMNSALTAPLFRVNEAGTLFWGSNTSNSLSATTMSFVAPGVIVSGNSITTTGSMMTIRPSSSHTITSGNVTLLTVSTNGGGFGPAAGTGTFIACQISPTINQTGSASAITRALYVAPTVTLATDFRAIETTVGNNMLNTTSGNTIIGGTTNANSSKLNVIGQTESTKFFAQAAGASTTVYPIEVLNTAGTAPLFRVNEAGTLFWGGSTNTSLTGTILTFSAQQATINQTNSSTNTGSYMTFSAITSAPTAVAQLSHITLQHVLNSTSGGTIYSSINIANTLNQTGSANGVTRGVLVNPTLTSVVDYRGVDVIGSYAPTSGTGIVTGFRYSPTINQTGGASGIIRGIHIIPTITAAADFRAIEVAVGKVVIPLSDFADDAAAAGGIPINGWYRIGGTPAIRLV